MTDRLFQDECSGLSRWLSNRVDALSGVRAACEAIAAERSPTGRAPSSHTPPFHQFPAVSPAARSLMKAWAAKAPAAPSEHPAPKSL